ncbi:flagellar basal body P-ring protein FlgI [Candidatus Kuenenia sp.]|uniref:flagellar basal body P-ring protein FlgI n=1 Tax=Candidatus Kuenenia sp. TaxID=2499824 RepID=UPI003220148A
MERKQFTIRFMQKCVITSFIIAGTTLISPFVHNVQAAVRIKDIAYVQGVRENQLYGYGIVIGLQGTGDNSQIFKLTSQMAVNVFEKLGVLMDEKDFFSKNTAVVMVTTNIPAFARPGDKLDITLSSIGDCKSLEGGVLLQTALQGADNEVYAVAQGALTVGGYSIEGDAQSVRKNIATTAHISNGAIVEKEIHTTFLKGQSLNIVLRDPDFTTSTRVTELINNIYPNSSVAVDAAVINIRPPQGFQSDETIVKFISTLEELYIKTDSVAKIIINERTGTIVADQHVRISTVAVAHGNLSITIKEEKEVSQPNMLGAGETRDMERTDIQVSEEKSRLTVLQEGVSISDVARALNVLGVTPRDLISIFQAIKKAGALHAELVIM